MPFSQFSTHDRGHKPHLHYSVCFSISRDVTRRFLLDTFFLSPNAFSNFWKCRQIRVSPSAILMGTKSLVVSFIKMLSIVCHQRNTHRFKAFSIKSSILGSSKQLRRSCVCSSPNWVLFEVLLNRNSGLWRFLNVPIRLILFTSGVLQTK